jgi:hypothetical protein
VGFQGAVGKNGPTGAQGAQGPPSDSRYKTNISPISNPRMRLVNLSGVRFEWIEDIPQHKDYPKEQKYLIEGKNIGFIAQEVEKLFPDLVWTDKYGYKNIQYELMVSIGVATLQENHKRVITLTNKIKDLNIK